MSKTLPITAITVMFAIALAPGPALAKERCAKADEATLKKMTALGIIETCAPVHALIEKSKLELPTEVLEKLAPWPFSEAVWWAPNANKITFKVPATREFENYAICSYRRQVISEIPSPGEYLKHGWELLTDKSIDYAWMLKRRGLGKGRTSLNVDVYFSLIPPANLAAARDQGLCMKDLTPKRWR